jgi:hypothetical protein
MSNTNTVIHFTDGTHITVKEAPGLVRGWMEQRKMVTLTYLNGQRFDVNTDNVTKTAGTTY